MGNLLALHLLTPLQDVGCAMLRQTLVQILNSFFIFLLLEVRVSNPSQGPVQRKGEDKHIKWQDRIWFFSQLHFKENIVDHYETTNKNQSQLPL